MTITGTPTNPFATRFTRPGAMRFVFRTGDDERTLVDRLKVGGWRGQIVGPHGTGKSTLLATLLPALEAAGRRVRCIALRQRERRLKLTRHDWSELSHDSVLVIDGYEQLSHLTRWRIAYRCRRRRCGLLVTAHRDMGFPSIMVMDPTFRLAVVLVRALLPPGDSAIGESDIETAWRRCRGNLREMLFDLYDLFELRRTAGG